MRENKLTVRINKPTSSVFDFTTNPDNTPLWIDSILSEKVNENPIRLGSRYINTNREGKTNTYEVSQLVEGSLFELKSIPAGYTVRYTYTPLSLEETELEYLEWVDGGELDGPFVQETMEKLKTIMER